MRSFSAPMDYIDMLLDEWGVDEHTPKLEAVIRGVLGELDPSAHLLLRRNPTLQVTIRPDSVYSVWAYFPVHKRRMIVRQLTDAGFSLRVDSRVLLVISEKLSEKDADNMRDHCKRPVLAGCTAKFASMKMF